MDRRGFLKASAALATLPITGCLARSMRVGSP